MSADSTLIFEIRREDHHPLVASERLLQQVLTQATPESVPSGILYRTPLHASPLAALDGAQDAPTITQEEFELALDDLREAALPEARPEIVGSGEARARAAAHHARGHVPIFIAACRFHALRQRVWVAVERQDGAGPEAIKPSWTDPGQLFEERSAFLASALLPPRFAGFAPLPPVHAGERVTFVVPADGLLGNLPPPETVSVDAGDGRGARDVRLDEPLEVTYGSTGPKVVTVRAGGPAGPLNACFRFSVAENIIERLRRDYDVSIRSVEGRVASPGGPARAEGLVINRKGAPVTRPVLMVEGFPFNYTWEDLFKYANQQDFALDLVKRGFTVVLVRMTRGPLPIQASAYALVEMIKDVISIRQGREPLVVGGFSMGGLVARFALTYMEHPSSGQPPHETAKFFTVDTPHEGANVSVAVQAFAQIEDPGGAQATLMRSAAAQQALLIHVPAWGDGWRDKQRFGAHPMREAFLSELQGLGSMPKLPDTIAIADGGGDGRFNQAAPGTLATGYACERKMWANLFFCSRGWPATVLVMRRRHLFDWTVYRVQTITEPPAYDSIPGGIWEEPIFRKVHDRTAGASHRILDVPNGSFIPTASALGIKLDDYFRPLTLDDLRGSYFKKVTYHQGQPTNEVHVKLTPQLVGFLRQQVFGFTQDA